MATAALRRHAARIPSAQHVDPNAQDTVLPTPAAVPTTTVRGGMLRECADRLDQEDDAGSVEYKWRLVGVSEMRLQHLMTQMQFRVGEGGGECIYELGVEDDGVPRGLDPDDYQQSLTTLRRMASRLGFTMTILFERVVLTEPVLMRCAEIRIRNVSARLACVRIAMMGQTGVGKSTLTSVLSNGVFDNGSGSARQSVFNHRHELETGRTSSVSRRLLGFDRSGDIINYEATTGHESSKYVFDAAELCNEGLVQRSASLIALMDLPGDTRCQTTAWRALLGRRPHCGCIVMSATDTAAPEEQMHLFASLDIPFFIVLTNQDRVTSVSALADLTAKINGAVQRIVPSKRARVASLRSTPVASPSKAPMSKADSFDFFIDDGADDVIDAEITLPSGVGMNKHDSDDLFISTPQSAGDKMQFPATTAGGALAGASVLASSVPLFVVSSVNGHGIDALRRFLHRVSVDATFKPPAEASATPAASAEEAAVPEPKTVLVHDLIIRDGVTIALGTVARNKIVVDDQLCIGPFGTSGIYYPVTVESIQIERLFASEACAGVDASFALDGPGADPELWTEGNQSSCSKKRCLVLTEPNNASKVTKCTVAAKLQAGMPRVDKAWSNLRENHETLFLCGCAKVPVRIHSKGPDASSAILSWTSPLHIDAGAFAAILTPAGVIVPLVVLNINPVTSSTPTKSPTSNIPTDDARSASQENGDTDGSSSTASPDSHHAPSATDSSSQSVGGSASEVLRSAAATECTNGKSPLDRRTARAGKRKHEKRNGAAAPTPTSAAPPAAITATTEHSSHVAAESKPVE